MLIDALSRAIKSMGSVLKMADMKKVVVVLVVNTLAVVAMIGVISVAGYLFSKFTHKDDSVVEEAVESYAERELEKLLDLETGKLKGTIDLTPSSPEDRAV
jgi:hypothetical protein